MVKLRNIFVDVNRMEEIMVGIVDMDE